MAPSRRRRETPPALLGNLQAALLHFGPAIPQFGDAESPSSTGGSYFTLADLWQSFEAWSAYGCEVPMRVQVDDVWQEVIQVYTPYLSGIQLFGADHTRRIRPSITPSSSTCGMSSYCSEDEEERCGTDSADESLGGGASDASSAYTCSTASTASTASDSEDGDGEGDAHEAEGLGPRCGKAASAAPPSVAARRFARSAARGSVLQKQQPLGEPTRPLFEYFEVERPHLRSPLHGVVMELAERCPELLTLDTRDLHPTSWFAVTWVPVYRIPSIPDPQVSRDLQANFLTFHSLAVPVQRLHATPADLCSLAPLPPLLDPIGAAAVAWRTEVARQQLLAAALSAISAAQAAQQQAAAAAAAAAATAAAAQQAQQAGGATAPQPVSPGSPASGAASPVAVLAAQLAAAALEGSAAAAGAPPAPQLPVAACCLRPFAFMPYKVSGRTWVDDWNLNRQHLPMIAAAGSWIERRKVQLPDFDFFSQMYRPLPTSHGHYGGGR